MEENVTTEELSAADKKRLKKEAKAREKEQRIKERNKNKTRKAIVTTTFFLTLLSLIAGLLVPLFNFTSEGDLQSKMLIRYIPGMFNNVCNFIAGKTVIPELSSWFLDYPCANMVDFFISLIGVLYVVVCAFTLLMCIPVFLGSKRKNTSANCALASEVLTVIVISCYIAFKTYGLVQEEKLEWSDYNFFIPFGVALIMAIVQSITSKGSIGVSKTIAVLLSFLGVVAILDVTLFIPALKSPLVKLCELIKIAGDEPGFLLGLSSEEIGAKGLGMDGINMLISIKSLIPELAEIAAQKDGWKAILTIVLLILIPLFTLINLVVDIIGLGTGKKFNKRRQPCANRGSNAFALTRYILTFLLGGGLIAITFFVEGLTAGLYLYLLEAVLLISIINAAARTAADNSRVKKGLPAPASEEQQQLVIEDQSLAATEAVYEEQPAAPEYAEAYAQPTYEQPAYDQQAYQQQVYDQQAYQQPYGQPYDQQYEQQPAYDPAAYQQPAYDQYQQQPAYEEQPAYDPAAYQQQPVYEQPLSDADLERYNGAYNPAPAEPLTAPLEQPAEPVPTVYIYGGATDEFMDSLTDTEKVEFVEVFIKKSKGVVKGVPEYVIDADNSDFFPAVFVHINRYRNIVSDALMSKMYKQLGKL